MRKLSLIIIAALAVLIALPGCFSATQSTIKEYNADGSIARETVTSESVIKTVIDSTRDKLVIFNDQSWIGGIYFVPPGSDTANPAGVLKIAAGKSDLTMITVPFERVAKSYAVQTVTGIASIVTAARAGEISLSSTGISSSTAAADTAADTATTTTKDE